jgi:murein DD-endopeptidase MepM/ murein hydrolase activator NlpD
MTRFSKRFPTSFRFGAVTIALIAVAGLAPLHASAVPTPQEIQEAKERVVTLQREVHAAYRRLNETTARADALAVVLEREQGRYELITSRLIETEQDLRRARERFDAVIARLNERAREAFINGPGSGIEFLLGATSLDDLSDRLAFMDAVTQNDVDLSTEVQNTKNGLTAKEADLEELRADHRAVLDRLNERRRELEASLAEASSLFASIQAKKAEAERYAKKLSRQRQAWVRSHFSGGGAHASVSMPAGWAGTLQVCPVDNPRAFGDGFGAPRYAGGYHLHAGVDIIAPLGTPIRATFAGTARSSQNTLGGLAVYVYGARGYTYNAHLSGYSSLSDGPVQAGDIIGYVGSTGDAGSINHDHFEFHPASIPSGWPVSYYGYNVIGDALNPYPLLVDACG